jgi:pyruvate dehydrogenase E2 component (dihydrolipoamide acetyltransferase)
MPRAAAPRTATDRGAPTRTVPPPAYPSLAAEPAPARDSVAHAAPAVRQLARELGVDLKQVKGSGPHARVTKEDVQRYVKHAMSVAGTATGTGFAVPELPEVDFSQFGEISEPQPLTKIQKLSGRNLHRSWVSIPHVTQFDEADITELEEFRKKMRADRPEVKLTLTSFFMKAVVVMLKQMPRFNSSLDRSGENLIMKRYFHIGVAVDTPNGLVVPVIRNVDVKGLHDLAIELSEVSEKARARRLSPADLQGASITISSLGGIGGTHFTPIINPPEVAVLGVSRAAIRPAYVGGKVEPRLMCGLSLSYDHRVIDGADGVRFTNRLCEVLADIREMLL